MRFPESFSYTAAVGEAGDLYQIGNGNKIVVPAYNLEISSLYDPTANSTVDWGFVTTTQPGADIRSLSLCQRKNIKYTSCFKVFSLPTYLGITWEGGDHHVK